MPTPEDQFSERLVSVIDDAGGAARVARELDLTPNAVRLWLRGTRPYPHHIRSLCEKFGIDRQWLLTGQGSSEVESEGSLAQSIVREPTKTTRFTGITDEELAARVADLVKNFARVPVGFLSGALIQLREHFEEFLSRAEKRAQGNGGKYPAGNNHKKHKP